MRCRFQNKGTMCPGVLLSGSCTCKISSAITTRLWNLQIWSCFMLTDSRCYSCFMITCFGLSSVLFRQAINIKVITTML
jgi:hypothetical protein